MTINKSQFVTNVAAGLSEDGHVAQLQFVRASGVSAYIQFPAAETASLLLSIEKALGEVFSLQRSLLKGQDPRTFFTIGAKRVSAIQGAVSTDGIPVLSIVLEQGVRLDLSLEGISIPELIEWLVGLNEASTQSPTSRS
jgi:hypothetical protein